MFIKLNLNVLFLDVEVNFVFIQYVVVDYTLMFYQYYSMNFQRIQGYYFIILFYVCIRIFYFIYVGRKVVSKLKCDVKYILKNWGE